MKIRSILLLSLLGLLLSGCGGGSGATAQAAAQNPNSSGSSAPAAPVVPGAPGAPSVALVEPAMSGATIWCGAPSSDGGSQITTYTATANPGGAQFTSTFNPTYGAISCRIDASGLSSSQSYTFTVTATNANGTGPSSSASSPVTPTAYAQYWITHGYTTGLRTGPNWYDYNAGSGAFNWAATPSNPPGAPSGTTITTLVESAPQYIVQPYIGHQWTDGSQTAQVGNGRINMSPFTYLTVDIYPLISGVTFEGGFEQELFFNGVATSGNGANGVLIDSAAHWVPNVFVGANIWNLTQKKWITGITGNTATQINFSDGSNFNPGDLYEVGLPDVGVGNFLTDWTGGGAWCANPLAANQWNTCKIPLTAFDSSATQNVSRGNILKFNLKSTYSGSPQTYYFANFGFL